MPMNELPSPLVASAGVIIAARPALDEIWSWLRDVPDPEVPVVSVVDLGIVRDVAWSERDSGLCIVTVTPTYSGCPATEAIGRNICDALITRGVAVELKVQLSPPWTTDWLTDAGREALRDYGIAPPTSRADAPAGGLIGSVAVFGQGALAPVLACPRCGSTKTETISRFGSTPCKSLHRCLDCLEPFDHFKCH